MATTRSSLKDYLSRPKQAYRSVNLRLDYDNGALVKSYLPTQKATSVLHGIITSMAEGRHDRATALIAPYGSGKSSLFLYLCNLLEGRIETKSAVRAVKQRIRQAAPVLAKQLNSRAKDRFIVVILSGDEGPLEATFCRALKEALDHHGLSALWNEVANDLGGEFADQLSAIDLYQNLAARLTSKGYKGIVVEYDEFGKVLESQQFNPRPADLYFLQTFAELCNRSGKNQIHLILSLHQAFTQYTHRLPAYVRNEWAKIEGRFRVVHYVEDSLQVYSLIAQAIQSIRSTRASELSDAIKKALIPYVNAVRSLPAFAAFKSRKELTETLSGAYPLDPVALYALPRLSARVAQNERTLFHFLSAQEPESLYPIFVGRAKESASPFLEVADLFDYFSDLMAKDVGVGGTSRRYAEIKAALDRIEERDTLGARIVKTIGIISVINEPKSLPLTQQTLGVALGTFSAPAREDLKAALKSLVKRKVLLFRRHRDEYRLWEGSDVDVLSILRHKKAQYEETFAVGEYLAEKLPVPYVLPHRYNEEFGLVRFFEGQICRVGDLPAIISGREGLLPGDLLKGTDGRIYYVLAESRAEIDEAIEITTQLDGKPAQSKLLKRLVFAIPKAPLGVFDPALELYCLEELLADPDFMSQDPVLRRELSELADDCLAAIRTKLVRLFEPRYGETLWVHSGEINDRLDSQAQLRRLLSDVCKEVFPFTPRLYNELINRAKPSATIVNARKKLIRAILTDKYDENLGLSGYGPEVAIFRTILRNTGLYRRLHENFGFASSEEMTNANLKRTIKLVEDSLYAAGDSPRNFRGLIEQLEQPPFGIRAGVVPILLAAVFKAFPLPLNLMQDGVYVKELKAETFEAMLLTPTRISVQSVRLPKNTTEYLCGLLSIFGSSGEAPQDKTQQEIVKQVLESIYRWVHELPSCAMTTNRLKESALQFRKALVQATDPVVLVLEEMPGLYLGTPSQGEMSARVARRILAALEPDVSELESYRSRILEEVKQILRRTFTDGNDQDKSLSQVAQSWVGSLVDGVQGYLRDPQCSGLVTRITSNYETDEALAESLASLVTGRSISYWDDTFLKQFELNLLGLHKRIMDANRLLARQKESREGADPFLLTVRVEHARGPAGELVLRDTALSENLKGLKQRLADMLSGESKNLTSLERQRILVELLKDEL